MANLIITESALIAIHIAAALGGIKTRKGKIAFEDIPHSTDQLNKMAGGAKKYFRTTYKGKPTFVTWISQNPVRAAKLKERPRLFHYKSYKLTSSDLDRLIYDEYTNKEPLGEMYFILSDTEKYNLARNLIKKTIKAENYYDVILNGLDKENIQKQMGTASRYGLKIDVRASIQRDINRTNAENEISSRIEKETVGHYELAVIALLKKRELLAKANKIKYQISGKAQIHGIPCSISSRCDLTKEEAELLVKGFPQTIVLDEAYEDGYKKGFLTAADLFDLEGIEDVEDIRSIAFNLYERGMISSPYSTCPYLAYSTKQSECAEILQACIDWTSEESLPKEDSIKAISSARKSDLTQTAIVPFSTKKKDHLIQSADDTDMKLYDSVIQRTRTAIKDNTADAFRFLAGEFPLYTVVNIEEIKKTLRTNEQIGASFTAEKTKEEKHFHQYRVRELFNDLQGRGIGTADIYFETFRKLKAKGLISISKNKEIMLTSKGEHVFDQVPAGKEYLDLCAKWEDDVSKEVLADWPIRAMEELVKQLDKDYLAWNKKDREKNEKKKDAPAPSQEKAVNPTKTTNSSEASKKDRQSRESLSGFNVGKTLNSILSSSEPMTNDPKGKPPALEKADALGCPRCRANAMTKSKDRYECASCGFTIDEELSLDGYKTSITDKDIRLLTENGRTAGKVLRSEDETITGYIVMDEGKIDITNRTTYPCPCCGEELYIYDWGFGCESCNAQIPFRIKKTKLSAKDMKALLQGEPTGNIEALGGRMQLVNGKPTLIR